jgi:hypothetical protein
MDVSRPEAETTRLLFVDSKNRDVQLFPNGNSYVLHLTTPIKNVTRVDLVSARVPNTMYNLTNGSNVFSTASANVSLNPGFYSAWDLATAVTAEATLTLDYLPNEGLMIFSSASAFTVTPNRTEFAKMVGLTNGTTYTAALATTLDAAYAGKYIVKSVTLVDLSLNEYIFLDIDELKTPWNLDAKSIDSATGTYAGSNAQRMFAPIIMDVGSSCIKNFHENKDYCVQATYPEPIGVLQRLTVNWYDKDGQPLNFRGWNTNAFVLRLHVSNDEGRRLPPPPPLQDVEIRRIVEAMTFQIPKTEKEAPRPKVQWWIIVLVLIAAIFAWKTFGGRSGPQVAAAPVKVVPLR